MKISLRLESGEKCENVLKSEFVSTWDAKIKAANTNDSDSKLGTYLQVNPNLINPTYDENQFPHRIS